jgi:hypothetical protein
MSVSAVSSASLANNLLEIKKQTPPPAESTTSSAQLPTDTVSLSSAAVKVTGGDVDHDGDSH